jgi:hypothetical protein
MEVEIKTLALDPSLFHSRLQPFAGEGSGMRAKKQ